MLDIDVVTITKSHGWASKSAFDHNGHGLEAKQRASP